MGDAPVASEAMQQARPIVAEPQASDRFPCINLRRGEKAGPAPPWARPPEAREVQSERARIFWPSLGSFDDDRRGQCVAVDPVGSLSANSNIGCSSGSSKLSSNWSSLRANEQYDSLMSGSMTRLLWRLKGRTRPPTG